MVLGQSQRVIIENENEIPLDLWIEPWGDKQQIPPGAEFEIVGEASSPGAFHIAVKEGLVCIYVWRDCTRVTVLQDGAEVAVYTG